MWSCLKWAMVGAGRDQQGWWLLPLVPEPGPASASDLTFAVTRGNLDFPLAD